MRLSHFDPLDIICPLLVVYSLIKALGNTLAAIAYQQLFEAPWSALPVEPVPHRSALAARYTHINEPAMHTLYIMIDGYHQQLKVGVLLLPR